MKDHKIEALRARIIKERHGAILLLGVGLVSGPLFLFGIRAWWAVLFGLLCMAIGIIGIFSFCNHTKNLKQLARLKESRTRDRIMEKSFYRPRVRLMYRTEKPYGYKSHIAHYHCYAIILFDENKQPYQYFLPVEIKNISKSDIAKIEEKFYRSIIVQYYEGTTLIKTIEHDPYFMRIRDT